MQAVVAVALWENVGVAIFQRRPGFAAVLQRPTSTQRLRNRGSDDRNHKWSGRVRLQPIARAIRAKNAELRRSGSAAQEQGNPLATFPHCNQTTKQPNNQTCSLNISRNRSFTVYTDKVHSRLSNFHRWNCKSTTSWRWRHNRWLSVGIDWFNQSYYFRFLLQTSFLEFVAGGQSLRIMKICMLNLSFSGIV